ncbi:MAG: PAS domain S-box protein [Verrucomicrobia bacterium]|nr:PAS domain S-box protein [Verrucomicrobiota bacterium]
MTTPGSPAPDPAAARPPRPREPEPALQNETLSEGAVFQSALEAGGRHLLVQLGRGAERIFGELPFSLPTGLAWFTARIHPPDEPVFTEALQRSRRELTPVHLDLRVRAANGTVRWAGLRAQPRATVDHGIVWDGVIVDINERHLTEEAVRRQVEFLAALNQTTLELVGRRDVPELLQALVTRAATLLASPHVEISLLEDGDLVVRAFSVGRDYLVGDRLVRGDAGLSWRALESRTPVIVDDYASEPDSRALYHSRGICAVAIFPILRGEQGVGVLGVARDEPGVPFSTEDIQEGLLLARMAALVLHTAGVHEEARLAAELRTAALRESEQRFRGLFDRSPVGIGLFALPGGAVVELNATALGLFGYTREEVGGRSARDLEVWVDSTVRDRYIRELEEHGAVREFEAEMRRKDGGTFIVLFSGCRVLIAGQPHSLVSLLDITARKHSEAARERSLALMRATLESTADGILVVNADGHIDTYNRNFAEMWRLDPPVPGVPVDEEKVTHAILGQLVSPEGFLSGLRDLYAGSDEEIFDIIHCTDGRVFERYSHPQLVANRPAGRVWSFRDITDRLAAEAALRQSEERFRVLAEVSPVGIFSSSPAGRTTFVNRRWCELSGLTPEQAVGDGWLRAIHPEDRDRVAGAWAEAVRIGQSSAAEFRFVRPDGAVVWLVGESRAHRQADGTLAGYVGTITDVTHLKRAEEERAKIESQLRQSRKMESLGTLAGGIAHDFNNILNGTIGAIDLARLELPPGHPVHMWLDQIATSSQRARELVRQILTFGRKTEGGRVPQRLHLVVEEALLLLRSSLPAMVELESRISPDAPAVLADSTQIHQVVLNLCTNAAHALPASGGLITVSFGAFVVTPEAAAAHPDLPPGPAVRLAIADNGSGMDAATLEQIFEPFFTTKATGAGTGLGLAVVHGIVKSHGAAILVHSTVGEGSLFEIFFPPAATEPAPPAGPPREIPLGHGEHILVVDDDAVSGFVIEKIVESLRYRCTRCTRPDDALARFAAAPSLFDLVVSDLAMPGMNGEELIARLSAIRPDLPIIVASGFLENARQRIIERGIARAVLNKPVSREEIARALAAALAG